jgi:hypothetical protein
MTACERLQASETLEGASTIRMRSDSPDTLAQMLKTTLHLVENRKDLDHRSASVSRLKESMRRTIDELEKKEPSKNNTPQAKPPARHVRWANALRRKKKSR